MMQDLLLRLIQSAGHTVVLWEPLTEAEVAEVAEITAPDLLITDYQMPSIDGLTAVRIAREVIPGLPVIVLTAIRDKEVHEAFQLAGVDLILLKPLPVAAIREAIESLLGKNMEPSG